MKDIISGSSKQNSTTHIIADLLSRPMVAWTKRRAMKREAQLDACYQQIFDGVVGGSLEIRIRNFPGSFEVNCRSHILRRILREKQYETETTDLITKVLDPKKDAVDVGANIGLYTVLLSKSLDRGRKVLAIEPTPDSLKYLRGNISRNSCSSSAIVYEGISTDHKGTFQLNVVPGKEEYSSLGPIVHASARDCVSKPIKVAGETIDRLVERFHLSPGLLKIDTEGAEYRVLYGARATLFKHRPIIISELSDQMLSTLGANAATVVRLLEELGYHVTSVERPDRPVSSPFEGEILAIHREHKLRIS